MIVHLVQLADLLILSYIHWRTQVLFYAPDEVEWAYFNATAIEVQP